MMMLRLFIALLIAALMTGSAAALYAIPTVGTDITITLAPQDPAPNSTVTLTAVSSTMDLSSATITWTVNDKTVAEGVGQRSAQVALGGIGSQVQVEVSASGSEGSATANLTLSPESVDLLFDGASYVPPFYRGRSLASPGSAIRAEAIPHMLTASGESLSAGDLIYTWKQDGAVLGSLSGAGRSSAQLPAPPLFGSSNISVEVSSADGVYRASASAVVPALDPGAMLYVDHPLFGVEYWNALSDTASVPEIETSFVAVPYFIPFASAADPRLSYAWSINGKTVNASSSASNELTVNAKGSSGPAALSLSLTSPSDYYLSANHSWTISFGGGGGSAFSPVPSPSSADAFHQNQ